MGSTSNIVHHALSYVQTMSPWCNMNSTMCLHILNSAITDDLLPSNILTHENQSSFCVFIWSARLVSRKSIKPTTIEKSLSIPTRSRIYIEMLIKMARNHGWNGVAIFSANHVQVTIFHGRTCNLSICNNGKTGHAVPFWPWPCHLNQWRWITRCICQFKLWLPFVLSPRHLNYAINAHWTLIISLG